MILGGIKFWNVLCWCWHWHTTSGPPPLTLLHQIGNIETSNFSIWPCPPGMIPGLKILFLEVSDLELYKVCNEWKIKDIQDLSNSSYLLVTRIWRHFSKSFDIQYLNREDITNLNCFIVLGLCYSSYIINSWVGIDFSHLIMKHVYFQIYLRRSVACTIRSK